MRVQSETTPRQADTHPAHFLHHWPFLRAPPVGVAYDATRKRLFVTGKYWPRIFEIVPKPVSSSTNNLNLRNTCLIQSRSVDALDLAD
jgi:hypothetical protein